MPSRTIREYYWPARLLVLLCLLSGSGVFAAGPKQLDGFGPIEHEVRSTYSLIRVRRKGDVRTLIFVRDNGQEVGETMIDLTRPHELLVPYTRAMFAGYLFRPGSQKVLMVGLGGGAMVQFLHHHKTDVSIDAIEIDSEVVTIADEYFGTKPSDKVRIMTTDGFDYLRETKERYDIVFMDAFLKPSRETDSTGVPLRLKTIDFLKQIQSKLNVGGVVVFNLNEARTRGSDIRTIRTAFPQSYVFRVAGSESLIVVGSTIETRRKKAELFPVARALDGQFNAGFSFQDILKGMTR